MHIKSIVAGAAIALIAGVGSVSADEITVDGIAVNTGTLLALPAGVATPMSGGDLDAVRGQGYCCPFLTQIPEYWSRTSEGNTLYTVQVENR